MRLLEIFEHNTTTQEYGSNENGANDENNDDEEDDNEEGDDDSDSEDEAATTWIMDEIDGSEIKGLYVQSSLVSRLLLFPHTSPFLHLYNSLRHVQFLMDMYIENFFLLPLCSILCCSPSRLIDSRIHGFGAIVVSSSNAIITPFFHCRLS